MNEQSIQTMFLSKDEVRTLTGRIHREKQITQLRKMGVPFYLNAAGNPIVARAAIQQSLSSAGAVGHHAEPNWGALTA